MERRKHYRYPLLNESTLVSSDHGKTWNQVDLRDVSDSGIFINKVYKPGDVLMLKFKMPGDLGYLQLGFKVSRVIWTPSKKQAQLGSGGTLVFNLPTDQKIWKSYVGFLRQQQIVTVSKRLISEFLGKSPDSIV